MCFIQKRKKSHTRKKNVVWYAKKGPSNLSFYTKKITRSFRVYSVVLLGIHFATDYIIIVTCKLNCYFLICAYSTIRYNSFTYILEIYSCCNFILENSKSDLHYLLLIALVRLLLLLHLHAWRTHLTRFHHLRGWVAWFWNKKRKYIF